MENPHGHTALTRETILKALSLLNEKLREEGVIGEICVFGGTAIVLAFDVRLSPKDVDAVFKPPDVFRRRAREIAEEIGIPADWLNDGVKAYVSDSPEYTSELLPQMSHLRIIMPTVEYLLAMKCIAARFPCYTTKGDRDDIAFLLNLLGLTEPESVFKIVGKFYPPERFLPKIHFLIRELLQRRGGGAEPPGTGTHLEPEP